MQVRKTKRKRNYYICENNPKSCDFIAWNKPKKGEQFKLEDNANLAPEEQPSKKTKTVRKTRTKKTAKSSKKK